MIVTCEKCQTKFELDDDRVKETGTKVRCSKCKHIFEVFLTPVEPVEQEPASPVEDQGPPEPSAESEEPKEDVVAEEQEPLPEVGEDEENLDFDFLEQEGKDEEVSSEESLDFELGDLELEPDEGDEGKKAPVEEAPAPEAAPAEDSIDSDLDIAGLVEEDFPLEESAGPEGEELSEESVVLESEDLKTKDEEGAPSETVSPESESLEEAVGSLDSEVETPEEEAGEAEPPAESVLSEETDATEESPDLALEEGAEISEEKVEEATVDEKGDSESPDDASMVADTEMEEPPSDEKEEEPSSAIEEEDFTLGDISEEDVISDEVESGSQEESGEDLTASEEKEIEEIPLEGESEEVEKFDEGESEEAEKFDEGESEESEESEEAPDKAKPAKAKPAKAKSVPAPSQKKKKPSLLLLILLIVASIAGGVYAAITFLEPFKTGFKIPYLNVGIGGEELVQNDPGNLKIALLNVKGYFEENKGAGHLFIMQGHVRNDYSKHRSLVQAKGILYDKAGKVVRAKSVYCGNILTKTELKDLSIEEINKKLLLQGGMNQSNLKIPPAETIPFMVVFEDLPGDLGEYSVEVEGSVAG